MACRNGEGDACSIQPAPCRKCTFGEPPGWYCTYAHLERVRTAVCCCTALRRVWVQPSMHPGRLRDETNSCLPGCRLAKISKVRNCHTVAHLVHRSFAFCLG